MGFEGLPTVNPWENRTDELSAGLKDRRLPTAGLSSSINYFIASINILATSGRLNSGGGSCPALSISRTLVPERLICSSGPLGLVLAVAIPPVRLHQKALSYLSGKMPRSS